MSEPRHGIVDGLDGGRLGRLRPAQHDDFDAERPRRADLAVGRAAAAVLGDDDIDAVRGHERAIVGLAERPAAGHVCHVRQRQRRIDRIDAADEIMVLRGLREWRQLLAAERDEDAARRLPQRANRLPRVAHLDPRPRDYRRRRRGRQKPALHRRLLACRARRATPLHPPSLARLALRYLNPIGLRGGRIDSHQLQGKSADKGGTATVRLTPSQEPVQQTRYWFGVRAGVSSSPILFEVFRRRAISGREEDRRVLSDCWSAD